MENKKQGNKLHMVLGYLILLVIAVLSFILFIKMGISFLGWLIMILLLLIFGWLVFKVYDKGMKTLGILTGIIVVLILVIFVFTGGINNDKDNNNGSDSNANSPNNVSSENDTSSSKKSNDDTESSVVSIGVDTSDLGNIINGQFYFDDGDSIYYSNFDDQYSAHIYKYDKKSKLGEPIFDGFGWSLVVHDGYLYFSGNEGKVINGKYFLYKMNLNDYTYEVINDIYSYNMNLYDNKLYFISVDSVSQYTYQRIDLDSGNKETIVHKGRGGNVVVFEKELYYRDEMGYIVKAEVDGSNPEIIVEEETNFFIIGNGKLIYAIDANILTCDMSGKNVKTIRESDGLDIYTLNSYKDTIYFTEYYSDSYNADKSGYNYTVRSIGVNGKNEKLMYEGTSWGIYINVIDGELYALDYLSDVNLGHTNYVTIISVVSENARDIRILPN